MTPNISEEESRVKLYLEELGFTSRNFSKTEKRSGKTPDFRVFSGEEIIFYCEVKSISKDHWLRNRLEEQSKSAAPNEFAGGARNDPIFNRVSSDIHEAVKQFDAVNKDLIHPNVLAFVNHDELCGFNDLLAVLTGNFYANDGTADSIYLRFSNGRIADERTRVHLFIWLDDFKPSRRLFSQTSETHHVNICTAFGVQQNEINRIG